MSLKLALIGHPVAHSRSPEIHRQFAEQIALDLDFSLIDCNSADLAARVDEFFHQGGNGMNVTLPHKTAAMNCCAQISPQARLAQAVNTLIPTGDGQLRGENTDGAGLIRDLKRLGIELAGKQIAIIGAGGAARGIIQPLLDENPAALIWSHRNPLKLEGQEAGFSPAERLQCRANMALKGDRYDLVINATSAGHQGLAPQLPHALFATGGIAYDLSYGPAAAPFLDWARSQGSSCGHTGLGMLIEQAALAFQHWTGKLPDTSALHAQLQAR